MNICAHISTIVTLNQRESKAIAFSVKFLFFSCISSSLCSICTLIWVWGHTLHVVLVFVWEDRSHKALTIKDILSIIILSISHCTAAGMKEMIFCLDRCCLQVRHTHIGEQFSTPSLRTNRFNEERLRWVNADTELNSRGMSADLSMLMFVANPCGFG